MDILSYFILEVLDLGSCISIVLMNCKLIVIDIVLGGCAVVVNPLPILLFLGLHFLVHLLLHHELLRLLLVHLRYKLSLLLGVADPLLSSLLLLRQLDQSRLVGDLLVSHHFQIIFSLHHVRLSSIHA